MFHYKNPALSPEERAKDLLSRMTLREKVGQMQLVCKINRNFDGEEFDKTYPNGLGATYDTIELNPEEINRMQKHMVENTRLGIPIFMMSESLHGFFCNGATVFPQSIGLGASFDRKLVEEVAKAAGSDARSMGVFETYAPNLDLSKDPRWGRVEENYGEDPYLTSRLGVAYVKGLQSNGIAACPKHYVAHGTPEAGLNKAPVHAGERELRETMLKPFAAAFMEGGAMSVMPAYSELDGVPVHSSRFLMTDILRGELGFEGWSVSDWSALILLVDTHFVAKDGLDAGKQALHAGIDMDAHTQFAYNDKFIEAAERGELRLGTMDAWLIWKLTGGAVHATDYTNASRTLLFNIHTLDWDDELLALFEVPRSMVPEAKPCDASYGRMTIEGLFPEGIEIAGVLGDSHGALAGQMCFEAGMGKATYGTGSSVMVNIGTEAVAAPKGLVTSVGFAAKGKVHYAFEGNIHCTGATLRWLTDQLQLIGSPAETEALATSVENTGGVYLVPAFAGLGAPWWNSEAKALICGMTLATTKAHVVRAALEAIPYQIKDLVDLMTGQAGVALKELRVDGGPTKNRFLMQFQADMLNATINRSDIEEASAMGAVVMNGLARGLWASLEEVAALRTSDNRISPVMAAEEREKLYAGWIEAVKQTNRNNN